MKEVFCNKCNKSFKFEELNELELTEFLDEGAFVCSNCINKEMESA